MKVYQVSRTGKARATIILLILAFIMLYSARKALGLWTGVNHKPSDMVFLGLDTNTFVPAFLLTLIALACIPVGWYLLVELFTRVEVTDGGIGVKAPGYRVFYRWKEVAGIEVLAGPQEDTVAELYVGTTGEENGKTEETEPEESDENKGVTAYLSEFDRRKDKKIRLQARQKRKEARILVLARATRADGRPLNRWARLLYPQARRPDRILLYPALEDRATLMRDIKGHLSRQ